MAATLLCQLGMALACLPSNSVMHMPTAKTTVVVGVVAFLLSVSAEVVYERIIDYKHHAAFWTLTAASVLFLLTALSFANPIAASDGRLAFRYPTIAIMLSAVLFAEFFSRKVKPEFGLPAFDMHDPGNVFFITAALIGVFLCILLPHETVLNYDDETHYKDSVFFSQGLYTAFNNADVREFYWFWDHDTGMTKAERESSDASLNEADEDGSLYLESGISAYDLRKSGYIGTAFGLWVGNALGLPASARFTLARIGNMLLYVAVVSLAIKKLKSGKMLLFVLAMCPYLVYSAACFNYDAWTFAFLALGLAVFFNAFIGGDRLNDRDLIIMLGSLFLGCLPKAPYAVILLLVLLLPRDSFADSEQRRKFYLFLAFAILFLLVYTLATSFGIGDPVDERGNGISNISGSAQVLHILKNPFGYFSVLLKFLFGGYLVQQAYLSAFGTLGNTGSYVLLLLVMLLAALTDSSFSVKRIPARIGGLALSVLTVMAAATVMYLVFTPVGYDTVLGCQQRYMIHLLFPAFMFALNGWFKAAIPQKRYHFVCYAAGAGILLYNIVELVVIPSLC